MGLRALHKALAKNAARTNGNHALDDVKSFAQRIASGVQQGAHALLLVFTQQGPTKAVSAQSGFKPHQQHHPDQAQDDWRQNPDPAQPCEENHIQAGCQHQDGGAQIGLLGDQPHRHHQQRCGHGKVQRAQLPLTLLKPPGQHQRHGNFENFAGLNHNAHIQPAARPFFSQAKQGHGNQQGHAQGVQRHGKGHQALGWDLRHQHHDHKRQGQVAGMVPKARAVGKTG